MGSLTILRKDALTEPAEGHQHNRRVHFHI